MAQEVIFLQQRGLLSSLGLFSHRRSLPGAAVAEHVPAHALRQL